MERIDDDILPEEPYVLHEEWLTKPISEISESGESSNSFKINDHIWKLIIFPKGYKTKDHLSILLMASKIINPHNVKFTIKTKGGEKIAEETTEFTFSKLVPNRGFLNFIPLTELSKYTTEDNKLYFELSIEFSPKTVKMGSSFRKTTGFVGLKPSGKTYFLNSFIQIMFHLNSFCLKILRQENTQNSPEFEAIQNLFTLLYLSPVAPSTSEISQLLGFNEEKDWVQRGYQSLLFKFFNSCQKIKSDTFLIKLSEINKQPPTQTSSLQNRQKLLFAIQINNTEQNFVSLQNYFNNFTSPHKEGEEIVGNKFSSLPPVLIIVINPFFEDEKHHKCKCRFTYPFELDMTPYMEDSSISTKYELFGIIGHQGEKFDGHFYAICRTSESRNWLQFDDKYVMPINELKVLEGHYGSTHTNSSAILLSYIRKDKISEIMKKIEYTDLPKSAISYYKKWNELHREPVPSVDLQLFTLKDYENKIQENMTLDNETASSIQLEKVPDNLQYRDILYEIQRLVGLKKVSLWELDNSLFPLKILPLSTPVKSVQKVFVSEHKDGTVPLLICFFDPDRREMSNILSIVSFEALNERSSPAIALQRLRATLGISLEEKMVSYIYNNQRAKRINVSQKIGSENHGIIIFQRENEEILNPQPISIDLLPELKKQRSFIQYLDFINNSGKITAVSVDSTSEDAKDNTIEFEISMRAHLRDLMRCIRALLSLPVTDSVLLFRKENNRPSHKPLNLSEGGTISQFLVGNFVFYKIIRGISQEKIEEKSLFQCSIINDRLKLVEKAMFLMPHQFRAIDVINKYRSKGSLSYKESIPLRIVQLNGPRIICTLNENSAIQSSGNLSYRIEVIPFSQQNIPTEKLLRVTFSKDSNIPSSSCFGFPFYLLVIEEEEFQNTLRRINEITELNLNLNFNDFQFIYSNDLSSIYFMKLDKNSKLSKVFTGKSTMLYIVPNDKESVAGSLSDLYNNQHVNMFY